MCQGRKKSASVAYPNMDVLSPPCALINWSLSSQALWVTYGDLPSTCILWYASLSSICPGPSGQWERKEGNDVAGSIEDPGMWGPLFPKLWGTQLGKGDWRAGARGRRSSLGQMPCSQDKPTLRLQVITGRKTSGPLAKMWLCWPCSAAWFHSLKRGLTRHRQPNAPAYFLISVQYFSSLL